MTEVTKYKCDVCGTIYETEEEAEECELQHIIPTAVDTCNYTKDRDGKMLYPSSVFVTMSDGTIREYEEPFLK